MGELLAAYEQQIEAARLAYQEQLDEAERILREAVEVTRGLTK